MRVPTYEDKIQLDVPNVASPKIPIPDISTSGDVQTAKNVQAFGQTLGNIAGLMQDYAKKKYDDEQDQILNYNYQNALMELNNAQWDNSVEKITLEDGSTKERTKGVRLRPLGEASGATNDLTQAYHDINKRYLESFKDQNTASKFNQMFYKNFVADQMATSKYEASELQKNQQAIADNAVAQFKKTIVQDATQAMTVMPNLDALVANKFKGSAPEVIQSEQQKARNEWIEKNAVSMIEADPTGDMSRKFINGVDVEDKNALLKKVNDVSKKQREFLKEETERTQMTNEAKFLDTIVKNYDGSAIVKDSLLNGLSVLEANKDIRPEVAVLMKEAIKKPIKSETVLNEQTETDKWSVDYLRSLLTGDKKQTHDAMIEVLASFGKNKTDREEFSRFINLALQDRKKNSAVLNAYDATVTKAKDYGMSDKNIAFDMVELTDSGMTPQEASQAAISNEIVRQNDGDFVKQNLAGQAIIAINNDKNNNVIGTVDKALYQFFTKLGFDSEQATEKVNNIISAASSIENKGEAIKKMNEALLKTVPGWREHSYDIERIAEDMIVSDKNMKSINDMKPITPDDAMKTFSLEVAKGLARTIELLPASFVSVAQKNLLALKELIKKNLASAGNKIVFGTPEINALRDKEFYNRSISQQKAIDRNMRALVIVDKAIKNTEFAKKWWTEQAYTGWESPDEKIFRGTFMENPSWTRAFATAAQLSAPSALAILVGSASRNPMLGASLLAEIQASENFNNRYNKLGLTGETAAWYVADLVAFTVTENMPIETFLNGGVWYKRIPSMMVTEGLAEEGTQQLYSNFGDLLTIDEKRDLFDGVVESIVAGTISGGLLGSLGSNTPTRVDSIFDKLRRSGVSDEQIGLFIETVGNVVADNLPLTIDNVFTKIESISQEAEKNLGNPEEPIGGKSAVKPSEPVKFSGQGEQDAKGIGKQTQEGSKQAQGMEQKEEGSLRVRNNAEVGTDEEVAKSMDAIDSTIREEDLKAKDILSNQEGSVRVAKDEKAIIDDKGINPYADVSDNDIKISVGDRAKQTIKNVSTGVKRLISQFSMVHNFLEDNPESKPIADAVLDKNVDMRADSSSLENLNRAMKQLSNRIGADGMKKISDVLVSQETMPGPYDVTGLSSDQVMYLKYVDALRNAIHTLYKSLLLSGKIGVRAQLKGRTSLIRYTLKDGKVKEGWVSAQQLFNLKKKPYSNVQLLDESFDWVISKFNEDTQTYDKETIREKDKQKVLDIVSQRNGDLLKDILPIDKWVAHTRKGNHWVIIQENVDGKEVTSWAGLFEDELTAQAVQKAIQKADRSLDVSVSKKSNADVYVPAGFSPADVKTFLIQSGVDPMSKEGQLIMNRSRAMSSIYSHIISRKGGGRGIAGWDTSASAIQEGMMNLAHSLVMRDYRDNIKTLMPDANKISDDFTRNIATRYIKSLSTPTNAVPFAEVIKSSVYFIALWNSPTYMVQNMTEVLWALSEATNEITNPVALIKALNAPLSKDYKELISRANDEGVLNPLVVFDYEVDNPLTQTNIGGQATERWSSGKGFEIGLKIAQSKGMSPEDGYKFAYKFLMSRAKPFYNESNSQVWTLSMYKEPAKSEFIRKYGFVFLRWVIDWMDKFFRGNSQSKAMKLVFATLLTGAMGVPFGRKIAEKMGIDPKKDVQEMTAQEKMILGGLLAGIGLDTGFLRILNSKGISQIGNFGKNIEYFAQKAINAKRAYQRYGTFYDSTGLGVLAASGQLLPGAIGRVVSGNITADKGVVEKRGKKYKITYEPDDTIEKMWLRAGFTPFELGETRARRKK